MRDAVAPPGESGSAAGLLELVSNELGKPAPPAAAVLARAIADRHGSSVASVLFYGSCLRKKTHEGVLDFYVLIDGYREFYGGLGWFAFANKALPPNVFYLEGEAVLVPGEAPTPVRCKYAVLSSSAFERLTSRRALHPYIWARFAQPARIAWARDDAARRRVEPLVANAVRTFIARLSPFMPARQHVSYLELWQEAFRRTYRTEFRGESPETIRAHYEADPERYARVTSLALESLAEDGSLASVRCGAEGYELEQSSARRFAARTRWQLSWPLAKSLALLRLFKTATTFGDWLPYALWKLERHSGIRPELTDRQRKHPFIFAWPVIFRLLTQRALR